METPVVAKKPRTRKEHVVLLSCKDAENEFEIGIDEAGRGPLFGRVYVAAVVLPKAPVVLPKADVILPKAPVVLPKADVILPKAPVVLPKAPVVLPKAAPQFHYEWMRDSKQIKSRKKIGELASYIKSNALAWHIHYMDAAEIDSQGILNCVIRAMHICVDHISTILLQKYGFALNRGLLLVDGNYFRPYTHFNNDTDTLDTINHETVEKGDGTYASIAAASILAKNERDTYIEHLCECYPDLETRYGLNTNMGYGTKANLNGIAEHGITQWHRQTFRGAAGEPLNEIKLAK